jgi:hypothetical protein
MYNIVLQLLAKNKQQGYASPEDFNTNINIAQFGLMDYLLGEFQQYAGGRPVARVQFGMNESVRQRLTPFIQRKVPLTIDSSGFAPYPDDYQQMDAMIMPPKNRIRFVAQHKEYSYANSQIDPVATNPIYLIVDKGFEFDPPTLGTALLSYVRTPKKINWGFIPDAITGLPVYAAGSSTDPEWYDVDCLDVIVRALAIFGVNLQLQQVEQYANQIKMQGQ